VLQQFAKVTKSEGKQQAVVGLTSNAGQLGHAVAAGVGKPADFSPGDLVQRVHAGLAAQFPDWKDKTDVFIWFQGEEWKPHGWHCVPGGKATPLKSLPLPAEGRLQIILSTAAAVERIRPAVRHLTAKVELDKVRVVVATNVAETSLTIHGVLHVVDSGVINLGQWDILAEKNVVGIQFHSQAGCRQRWGRAGRLQPGDAWPLYTQTQFESFARYSVGEIMRAGLEQTLLKAKIAGIDDVGSPSFPWFEAPPPAEYKRALLRLAQNHALDADGDVTELDRNQGDRKPAQLLMHGDRFVCALEMAAILPFFADKGIELKKLFLGARRGEADQQALIGLKHLALRAACEDDLDLVFKLFEARGRYFPVARLAHVLAAFAGGNDGEIEDRKESASELAENSVPGSQPKAIAASAERTGWQRQRCTELGCDECRSRFRRLLSSGVVRGALR